MANRIEQYFVPDPSLPEVSALADRLLQLLYVASHGTLYDASSPGQEKEMAARILDCSTDEVDRAQSELRQAGYIRGKTNGQR